MTQPLIYVSYGMAKSGSTLAFQLVSAILEEAGVPQYDLDLRDGPTINQSRYVGVIRPQELDHLKYVAARRQTPIAVKTHGGMWRCMENGLNNGWIIGHAVCRDPRDIALSMMDASRENRAWGQRDGQPLRHIEDALDYVRGHSQKFASWARHPNVLALPYERVAFDTEATAIKIAGQLGVDCDAKRVAKIAKASHTQFNKGRSRRHADEMSAKLSEEIRAEFADFIDNWCEPDFVPPKKGILSRITGG
ncbi:MAG: sulfotransferase domain-containing protein [Pseudomonadota bacterium]